MKNVKIYNKACAPLLYQNCFKFNFAIKTTQINNSTTTTTD